MTSMTTKRRTHGDKELEVILLKSKKCIFTKTYFLIHSKRIFLSIGIYIFIYMFTCIYVNLLVVQIIWAGLTYRWILFKYINNITERIVGPRLIFDGMERAVYKVSLY